MARTKDGKVYANKAGLIKSISILDGLITDLDNDRKNIYEEMGSFLESYDSVDNKGIINNKKEEINSSIIEFLDGEKKVVNSLFPDVIDRFDKGYIGAMKSTEDFVIANNSNNNSKIGKKSYGINGVVENIDLVNNIKALKPNGDITNITSDISSNISNRQLEDVSVVQDVSSTYLYSSKMDVKSIEIVQYVANSITIKNGRIEIDMKYQVKDVSNKRYNMSAKIDLPSKGKIKNIDLVLAEDVNSLDLYLDDSKKKESMVVSPVEFNVTMVAKLVLEIATNPVEILGKVFVANSELLLDLDVGSSLEIQVVSIGDNNSKLELISNEKELINEVKNVSVIMDSELKVLE